MIFTKSTENHQNGPKIPIKSMCVGYIRGLGRFCVFSWIFHFLMEQVEIMKMIFKNGKTENHEI